VDPLATLDGLVALMCASVYIVREHLEAGTAMMGLLRPCKKQ
jgi:hypothetical protein